LATERFDPARLLFSMRFSSALYRDELAAALAALSCVPPDEAEHLVATAGEDEAAYAPRDAASFLAELCRVIDDFLADDDGGFHQMTVHVTRYERSPAVLEVWFHVGPPGATTGGAWFRQLAVRLDTHHLYAAIGPRIQSPEH